jgi:hypothetical protein
LFRSGGIVLVRLGFSATGGRRKAARMRSQLARNGKNGVEAAASVVSFTLMAEAGDNDEVCFRIVAIAGNIAGVSEFDDEFANTGPDSDWTANIRLSPEHIDPALDRL